MAVSFMQYALSGVNALGDYAAKGMTQYSPTVSGKSSNSNFLNSLIIETILIIIGFMVISSVIKRSL